MPSSSYKFDYSQYNSTNSPTANSFNSINQTATFLGYRDFLLKRNIGGSYYNISTNINGSPNIGEPNLDTSINNDTNLLPNYYPIQSFGVGFKDKSVVFNQFQNTDSTANDLEGVQYTPKDVKTPINNGLSSFSFGNTVFPLSGNSTINYKQSIDGFGILAKSTYAQFTQKSTQKNLYSVPDAQTDSGLGIDNQNVNEAFLTSHNGVVAGQGYADQYGNLNQGGGPAMAAADVLGSILGGQGVGFSKGGIVSNFDIRSSIVGRVLGATGTINDTNLGKIGGTQLAMALANNAAFNVQQELLGKLNLQDNVLSLIKGNGLAGFRPNYQITVPSSGVGKFFDGAAKILGFTVPTSFISDEGSIFASENGNIENVKRANALLLNTGKGQFISLIKNANANIQGTTQYDNPQDLENSPFRSGYAPGYENNKGINQINGDNIYAYSDGKGQLFHVLNNSLDITGKKSVIPDLSFYREKKTENSGFIDPNKSGIGPKGGKDYSRSTIKQVGFAWTSDIGGTINTVPPELGDYDLVTGPKKSLMYKTQELFRSGGMLNMSIAKGNTNPFYIESSQIQTTNAGGISKGSAVVSGELYDLNNGVYSGGTNLSADNVYARAWTTLDRYDSVSKLIRHKGLDEKVPYRHQMLGSVLDDNGFAKISPYVGVADDPKKYMFSIENLAWSDQYPNLLPCERGSGDLLTGKKGRIMWFPPYDIQFNEQSNVEWESNKFIGRGESVYTYSNTERSGTLSFKVVVDHPTYVNSFEGNNGPDDNYVASFFAGEIDPSQSFSNRLTSYQIDAALSEFLPSNKKVQDSNGSTINPPIEYYFPNDVFTYYNNYENGSNILANKNIVGELTSKRLYNVGDDLGKNKTKDFNGKSYSNLYDLASGISDFLNIPDNAAVVVTVQGWASIPGQNTDNDELASKRADTIITILKDKMTNVKNIDKRIRKIANTTENAGCDAGDKDQNGEKCKIARKVVIGFDIDYNLVPDDKDIAKKAPNKKLLIQNPFYGECQFFEKLKQNDEFVFDKFRDKIKYFHPAFHSTTPEGLNSRLTFLLQCTRQGPTLDKQGANNLAFGRPPVCILRIGDFYNTKIIIDSVTFDYEPLVWDLNPEGIGVQPMIANVNMSFKFIGGSTLLGPINKLQNALSFNYFANTHVYDVRADYLAKVTDPSDTKTPSSDYELHNTAHEKYNDNLNNGVTATTVPIEIDQVASSDASTNGKQEAKEEQTAKITKISYISLEYVANKLGPDITTPDATSVKIKLNINETQQQLDAEFKNYINKGLKFKIAAIPNSIEVNPENANYFYEEIVRSDGENEKDPLGIFYSEDGYQIGDIYDETVGYALNLPQGQYVLTVIFAEEAILSKPFTVKHDQPITILG